MFNSFGNIDILIQVTTPITVASATGIQSGAVTHHQDQEIVLVSFRIKNTINKTLGKFDPPATIGVFII